MYKCFNGLLDFSHDNYISLASGRTRSTASNLNLRPQRFRTSLFRDSYFNRIVPLWNNLPISIRQSPNVLSFKKKLNVLYFEKLESEFDPTRVQTWKDHLPVLQDHKPVQLLLNNGQMNTDTSRSV